MFTATYARVPSDLNRSPLVHSGPMCWTVSDALIAYHHLAGPSLTETPGAPAILPPKLFFREGFQSLFTEGNLPHGFKIGLDIDYIKVHIWLRFSGCFRSVNVVV